MKPVSPGNPCPFLRALVAVGLLSDEVEPLGRLSATVARVAAAGDGRPRLPALAIRAIALVAAGLGPAQLARTGLGGLRLGALRGGPLDKRGAGSGILDARGEVVEAELARLDTFASDKESPDGTTERGLSLAELTRFMDANFARAAGRRRIVDRKLMDGEWPVLLQVLGRDGAEGRYLPVADVGRLFAERKLPRRMLDRLALP
ncbi:MAG: hypothetical protein HZB56_09940 [Deltaproteobacteria bacterium]|nr:hypothetical protein [Deltaproteobacteria bacterium]